MHQEFKHDEIGYWTEIKHEIIKKYAQAYSIIMNSRSAPEFYHVYIDAFAGSGEHISKRTGRLVPGSPLYALQVEPPFKEYYFIELQKQKVATLEELVGERPDVTIYHEDCNQKLLESILPKLKYEDYKRALCILDPYGMHLDWEVIYEIGKSKSIEIFLNFPILDMNRNVLRHKTETVTLTQMQRMDRFWGDRSWRDIAYTEKTQRHLFLNSEEEKQPPIVVVKEFQNRLKNIAGFANVPDPIPMRNSKGGIVYYLFFASHNKVGNKIVKDIFKSYKNRRGF